MVSSITLAGKGWHIWRQDQLTSPLHSCICMAAFVSCLYHDIVRVRSIITGYKDFVSMLSLHIEPVYINSVIVDQIRLFGVKGGRPSYLPWASSGAHEPPVSYSCMCSD